MNPELVIDGGVNGKSVRASGPHRSSVLASACLGILGLLQCMGGSASAASDRLVLLNGKTVSGQVKGIDGQEDVRAEGVKDPIPLQGLRMIVREAEAEEARNAIQIHLIDGSLIKAKTLTAAEDMCTVSWAYGKRWQLPFDAFRGALLARPGKDDKDWAPAKVFLQGLVEKEAKEDVLYAGSGKKIQAISGGLQSIDRERATFVWEGTARKIGLGKIHGITFARTREPPENIGRCLVHMRDGSRIWGKVAGLVKGMLNIKVVGGKDLSLPWKSVVKMQVRSDRLIFLSDLEPSDVVQEAQVTFAGPWRADKSVLGNPLTLGEEQFEKGLGVHALCRLTYPCTGNFEFFAATIGIDSETKGKGDCIFKVLAGGKELFQKRMRGVDKAAPVRVNIAGLDEITLAVEPGEDLDLADHANWCDARFLKE